MSENSREPVGLVNGNHYYFPCSNCRRKLCDLHITKPDDSLEWRIRVKCCYGCTKQDGSPEYSFIEDISGRFHFGGYGVDNPDNPDDSEMQTVYVREQIENDSNGQPVLTFEVAKSG